MNNSIYGDLISRLGTLTSFIEGLDEPFRSRSWLYVKELADTYCDMEIVDVLE